MWLYLITVLLLVRIKESPPPTVAVVPIDRMNSGQRRIRTAHGHNRVHPWNIARLPSWHHAIRIMCILCLITRDRATQPSGEGCGQHIWARWVRSARVSRMRWDIRQRLVTLSNDMDCGNKAWNYSQWRLMMAHDVFRGYV